MKKLIIAGGIALAMVAAPAAASATEAPAAAAPVTYATAGDSITTTKLYPGYITWPAAPSATTKFTGEGWAEATGQGAKCSNVADNMRPIAARVLVLSCGTNDFRDPGKTTYAQRLVHVDRAVYNARATRVLVLAVPPTNHLPVMAAEWNVALRAHAAKRGWTFMDPWAALRTPANTFVGPTKPHDQTGLPDGWHPTSAAQLAAQPAIAAQVVAVSAAPAKYRLGRLGGTYYTYIAPRAAR